MKYYNLFVTGDKEAWNGKPFRLELSRCISKTEWTSEDIANKYSDLKNSKVVEELKKYPCIFAYERICEKNPKVGFIKDLIVRQGQVQIEYKIIDNTCQLNHIMLDEHIFDLDIYDFELNRTHWAIKNISLEKFFAKRNLNISIQSNSSLNLVDITKHKFDVALSFPGEYRDYVNRVSKKLDEELGKNRHFYDENYKSQLAAPSLDLLLQDIYRNRSELVVVFICEKYNEKKWCGLEFRAIRDVLFANSSTRKIMYIKMDEGQVEGVLNTDGYIDGRSHSPEEIAEYIIERIRLYRLNDKC